MKQTEYNISFSTEVIERNVRRLTNQLWKLIPMYEHGEDWQKQLDTVLIEIVGMSEIFDDKLKLLQLISKLRGLIALGNDIQFILYRKSIFEAISLLQGWSNAK